MISIVSNVLLKKIFLLLAVLLTIIFASCGKAPDLSRLKENNYYVAQNNECSVVLYVEKVTKKSFKGRWYIENGNTAQPHYFEAISERPYRKEMRSDSLVVKTDAMSHGDVLTLSILLDGSLQSFDFQLWQQPSAKNLERKYPYFDSMYDVSCEKDVPFAHAKGYWVSYPEHDNGGNDYLSIVLEKMTIVDLTQKDLVLTMDIYSPVTNDSTRHPLLLLIHGGAFFNGDKEAAGYKEWGEYFASRGYIVASINYRLGFLPIGSRHVDRAGYRAVQDAYAAVCYLLRHPEQYLINPNYIFVGGSSAGGITALNLAFMRDEDRPECTKAGIFNNASHLYNELADNILDYRKRRDIGNEDLGNISVVAENSGGIVDFKVNAVVNMWGAVHKIDMIDNTNNTAILSFHGDADSVVAYDYNFPFTKVKTPVRDFIGAIKGAFRNGNSWFSQGAYGFLSDLEDNLNPVNQFLCNKMYGSKCIHEQALLKGMKSELHTKTGGGHSLHVNNDGTLSLYFTYISDITTRFLYPRMFPRPILTPTCVGQQQWFELDNAGLLLTCSWEAEGGLVLQVEPDKARVLFFADADEHNLLIAGQDKNGQGYNEIYSIE